MGGGVFGILGFVGVVLTPVIGVGCGLCAQRRYKLILDSMPPKIAATMPKRFPKADVLLALFMLGPVFGDVALGVLSQANFSPSPLQLLCAWTGLAILLAVNLSGPHLVQMGMPPDGSFRLLSQQPEIQFVGKPTIHQPVMFDAREL